MHFLGEGIAQCRARLALLAKAIEEQLVQDHRVHGDKLLALEAVDQKTGGLGVVELGELLIDEIEALHRAAD